MADQRPLDAADQRELDLWQRHGLTRQQVLDDIAYVKKQRKKWKVTSWYDQRIEFLEWLLEQPRLPE